MLEDRNSHNALIALAAVLFGGGLLLLTIGVFAAFDVEFVGGRPIGLCGFGTAGIMAGMCVGSYVKHRMRT